MNPVDYGKGIACWEIKNSTTLTNEYISIKNDSNS